MIIMEMCKEADIILAGGHLLPEELIKLAKAAKEMHYHKFMINHPFFKPPAWISTRSPSSSISGRGSSSARAACADPGYAKLSDYTETLKRCGPSHFVIATDGGHNRKPWPTRISACSRCSSITRASRSRTWI
jgi:hypothetical protein